MTRSASTVQGGFTWIIIFTSRPGPQPLIQVSSYLVGVNTTIGVTRTANGSALGGHFFLYSPPLPIAGLCGHSADGHTIVTSTDHVLAGTLSRGDRLSVNGSNGSYFTIREDVRYALDGTTYSVYPRARTTSSAPAAIEMVPCWYRKRSGQIRYDATPSELKRALDSRQGFGMVDVSRSGPDNVLGYRWQVTFSSRGGKLGLSGADFRGLTGVAPEVRVVQLFEGTMENDVQQIRLLNGGGEVFNLQYGWEGDVHTFTNETTALELKTHLDQIRDVGCVSVTKELVASAAEARWNVTFLTQRGHQRDGFHVFPASTASLRDLQASGTLQGTFQILFREGATSPIAANASAETVQSAINALPVNADVSVTRSDIRAAVDGRFIWSITFLGLAGDVPLLSVGASGLSGIAVS